MNDIELNLTKAFEKPVKIDQNVREKLRNEEICQMGEGLSPVQ